MLKIAVILGSTREGRFGPAVASWVMDHLHQRDDMSADLIDLAETPLPCSGSGPPPRRPEICWQPCHRAWRRPTPSSS
jgi:NAD(P)H-dependent FMN reductase